MLDRGGNRNELVAFDDESANSCDDVLHFVLVFLRRRDQFFLLSSTKDSSVEFNHCSLYVPYKVLDASGGNGNGDNNSGCCCDGDGDNVDGVSLMKVQISLNTLSETSSLLGFIFFS